MISKVSALFCVIGFAVSGIAQAQSPNPVESGSRRKHNAGNEKHNTTIEDIGPKPQSFDLENATRSNKNYRTTVWTGRYLQMTLMSIPVGRDIG